MSSSSRPQTPGISPRGSYVNLLDAAPHSLPISPAHGSATPNERHSPPKSNALFVPAQGVPSFADEKLEIKVRKEEAGPNSSGGSLRAEHRCVYEVLRPNLTRLGTGADP